MLFSCMMMAGLSAHAQVDLGFPGNTGMVPILLSQQYSYSQQIFQASEIKANSGSITGLKFYLSGSSPITNSKTWKVYLGYTDKSQFSSNSDWIPLTSLTQVFEGDVEVIPFTGEVTVNFSQPFLYINTNNLVIAVDEIKPGDDFKSLNSFATYPPSKFAEVSNKYSLVTSLDHTSPEKINTSSPPEGFTTSDRSAVTLLGLTKQSLSESQLLDEQNDIKVYPNPFVSDLNIPDVSKVKSILVRDTSGATVKTINNPSSSIYLGDLKSGIYYLRFEMKDGSTRKLSTVIKK